jgi:Holliday junction resolvasome RuvABC endonuclease subunit
MRAILGIDPSTTSTGAVLLQDDVVEHVERWAPKARGVECLAELDGRMTSLLDNYRVDEVAIEGYSYGSPFRMADMGEVGGVLRLAVWRFGLPFVVVSPPAWRKRLFGKGTLAKDQVRLEAFKRYGVEFETTDEVEAWCVAMCVYRQRAGLEEPAPKRRAAAS